jgi:hypothetical protein
MENVIMYTDEIKINLEEEQAKTIESLKSAILGSLRVLTNAIATPLLSPNDVEEFLKLVVRGEQDKAEAMLKLTPALALMPGNVTDLSDRVFNDITGFQYAVLALDWHMWTMIERYLHPNYARLQAKGFENGALVKKYGFNVELVLSNLISAYEETLDAYESKEYAEGDKIWLEKVGEAQRLLPAHVANEYCHPTRSFDPTPDFRDVKSFLPRSSYVASEWFTALTPKVYGTFKAASAAYRSHYALVGISNNPARRSGIPVFSRFRDPKHLGIIKQRIQPVVKEEDSASYLLMTDRNAILELSQVRIAQRKQLIDKLGLVKNIAEDSNLHQLKNDPNLPPAEIMQNATQGIHRGIRGIPSHISKFDPAGMPVGSVNNPTLEVALNYGQQQTLSQDADPHSIINLEDWDEASHAVHVHTSPPIAGATRTVFYSPEAIAINQQTSLPLAGQISAPQFEDTPPTEKPRTI